MPPKSGAVRKNQKKNKKGEETEKSLPQAIQNMINQVLQETNQKSNQVDELANMTQGSDIEEIGVVQTGMPPILEPVTSLKREIEDDDVQIIANNNNVSVMEACDPHGPNRDQLSCLWRISKSLKENHEWLRQMIAQQKGNQTRSLQLAMSRCEMLKKWRNAETMTQLWEICTLEEQNRRRMMENDTAIRELQKSIVFLETRRDTILSLNPNL